MRADVKNLSPSSSGHQPEGPRHKTRARGIETDLAITAPLTPVGKSTTLSECET
jgi:hypothetical protein